MVTLSTTWRTASARARLPNSEHHRQHNRAARSSVAPHALRTSAHAAERAKRPNRRAGSLCLVLCIQPSLTATLNKYGCSSRVACGGEPRSQALIRSSKGHTMRGPDRSSPRYSFAAGGDSSFFARRCESGTYVSSRPLRRNNTASLVDDSPSGHAAVATKRFPLRTTVSVGFLAAKSRVRQVGQSADRYGG